MKRAADPAAPPMPQHNAKRGPLPKVDRASKNIATAMVQPLTLFPVASW